MISGEWKFSGNACAVDTPTMPTETAQEKKDQDCIPNPDGQTYCQKANGDQCYQSSTGRQICWRPGETGQKTDGPVAQERKPGEVTPPDTKQLPNGETGVKQGDPVTTTTTVTNPNGTTTIITTTTNYKGPSGADAGDKNDGQNGDGTGTPAGGGDDDNDNTSSGGGNCETAPTSSGDPILGNILTQTWYTRCNTEKNKLEGNGACGTKENPAPAPTCTGDAVLCRIAEVARLKRCDDVWATLAAEADAATDDPDDGAMPSLWEEHDGNDSGFSFDPNKLNMQAGSGELFPTFEMEGQTFEIPQAVYDLLDVIKALVIAAFTLWGMFIAGGSNRT